jgi:hypothetical protein
MRTASSVARPWGPRSDGVLDGHLADADLLGGLPGGYLVGRVLEDVLPLLGHLPRLRREGDRFDIATL